jgi:uncharacterized protein YjbI with pentapeptide repeats
LEKLAHDYEPLHWSIMEILCAYVRKNTNQLRQDFSEVPPYVDVQAALSVIGRRSEKQRKLEQKKHYGLDLRNCNLVLVNLSDLHFENANFSCSRLEGATLTKTHFEGAVFFRSNLERASFIDTHLDGTAFKETSLKNAYFERTDFAKARCLDVHFEGANLYSAHGVMREMLENCYGDEATRLPPGVTPPTDESWKHASDQPRSTES